MLLYPGETYINRRVVENLVRNVDRSVAAIAADGDDAISFVGAERIEDLRQRAVS